MSELGLIQQETLDSLKNVYRTATKREVTGPSSEFPESILRRLIKKLGSKEKVFDLIVKNHGKPDNACASGPSEQLTMSSQLVQSIKAQKEKGEADESKEEIKPNDQVIQENTKSIQEIDKKEELYKGVKDALSHMTQATGVSENEEYKAKDALELQKRAEASQRSQAAKAVVAARTSAHSAAELKHMREFEKLKSSLNWSKIQEIINSEDKDDVKRDKIYKIPGATKEEKDFSQNLITRQKTTKEKYGGSIQRKPTTFKKWKNSRRPNGRRSNTRFRRRSSRSFASSRRRTGRRTSSRMRSRRSTRS